LKVLEHIQIETKVKHEGETNVKQIFLNTVLQIETNVKHTSQFNTKEG
jgi:hypothetical protein